MNICFAVSDVDWALSKDVFSIVGTLVSLIGVGAAIYFGSQGLSAWKKQLRGSTDHNLAMEMLVCLYKFRDSISASREPVFLANSLNFGGALISMESQIQNYAVFADALKARHALALSAKASLEAAAMSCEAAWGDVVISHLSRLQQLYSELEAGVKTMLIQKNPQAGEDFKSFYAGMYGGDESIVFNTSEQASAEFTDSFCQALSNLESLLKSKLSK